MPLSPHARRWRAWPLALIASAGVAVAQAPAAPSNSTLDAPLFYHLLLGEVELRNGNAGAAYALFLDVAQRTRDEALFRRAVEVALQARAGDQALAAARAWRVALPASTDALRFELQILAALNRHGEMSEPLQALLQRTPQADRGGVIASLPRLMLRGADKRDAAVILEAALQPYAEAPATRTAARVAVGRAWWQAGDAPRALAMAQRAAADDPAATGPILLALELMPTQPAAQALVDAYVTRADAEVAVQLAHVRVLTAAQRYVDARRRLQAITHARPELAPPWLSLGALQLELREPRDAEASLQRFLALRDIAPSTAQDTRDDDEDDDAQDTPSDDGGRTQAWLMLAQAAEMRGDLPAAGVWLDKIENPQRALDVQTRRASLLARQGKLREARALVQQVPERRPEDARLKLMAESQVLRDVKRWGDAYAVLATASERFPSDADLLYEQAMMAEKLGRLDEMERLLRRVIEIKPDHQHAYNALGYSLAERNMRLPEARSLVLKALELAPGDPFITDSVGWIEYRLGNHAAALEHLRRAYASRPDTEIGAHLGEVLWVTGQRDEAMRIWREARTRDADNEVLRETLARLQVRL
ncbi:MAG TPA: tetratricopeptide repeat protein [Burkholderiaceae bacterium]|nr:tetratricopeptide repeat protein [Burkholderiaceae bacterium]